MVLYCVAYDLDNSNGRDRTADYGEIDKALEELQADREGGSCWFVYDPPFQDSVELKEYVFDESNVFGQDDSLVVAEIIDSTISRFPNN